MSYSWVPTTIHTPIPLNAILAGYDTDGSRIFVGRAYFQGDLIPCKVIPSKAAAYVSNNGVEYHVGNHFEILCGYGLRWVTASHGVIPSGSVPAGCCRSGDTLFIGRAYFLSSLTPGKVSRLSRCLLAHHCGREYAVPVYEILVSNPIIHLSYRNTCSIQ